MKLIRETAADICYTIKQDVQASESELSGKVQTQLNGVVSKVIDLNIDGTGKLKTEQYQGVLRNELAYTLRHSADCRNDVFHTLVDKLLQPQKSGDTQRSDPIDVAQLEAARSQAQQAAARARDARARAETPAPKQLPHAHKGWTRNGGQRSTVTNGTATKELRSLNSPMPGSIATGQRMAME